MTIRFATLDDIETLVGYWREFHPQSAFRHLAFDAAKLAANVRRVIEDQSGASCFFVSAGEDGKAKGVLVGQIDTYYFSSDPIARMVFYWVHPQHRYSPAAVKLMLAFRQWAQNRQAAEIMIGVTSGEKIERTGRMLKKMGGTLVGGNYNDDRASLLREAEFGPGWRWLDTGQAFGCLASCRSWTFVHRASRSRAF